MAAVLDPTGCTYGALAPVLDPTEVYASSYPEIITAAVSGPEFVDGKQVFTFKTAVGTKG
jgi:PRTRC genetic system protein C